MNRCSQIITNNVSYKIIGLSGAVQTVSDSHRPLFLVIGRAECVRCPWLLAQTKVATIFGNFKAQPQFQLSWAELALFWSEQRCADSFVETAVGHYFGPSGAVQTVSSKRAIGHYFWYFSFFFFFSYHRC